jgi:pimeloyl-ACP methyl ester carboxylesterase
MALRPSQIRATSIDGALMIPGAVALRRDYKDLTLPVVIIAGDGDKVVFKRRSVQLRGSMLQVVKGAGHMVHHLAPRQVAQAVESVAEASHARTRDGQAKDSGPNVRDVSAAV